MVSDAKNESAGSIGKAVLSYVDDSYGPFEEDHFPVELNLLLPDESGVFADKHPRAKGSERSVREAEVMQWLERFKPIRFSQVVSGGFDSQ